MLVVCEGPSSRSGLVSMSRGLTSVALGLVCGVSFLVSPLMIFRAEWVVRTRVGSPVLFFAWFPGCLCVGFLVFYLFQRSQAFWRLIQSFRRH